MTGRAAGRALAAVLAAAALTAAGCSTAGPRPPDPRPAQTSGRARVSVPSLVPRRGVILGAYVQPATYTPRGLIDAVAGLDSQIGRPVRLVHVYHSWLSPFPDQADRHFAATGKVLLLTWSGTVDTRAVTAGRYDALIRARAEALKKLGRPVLLEFRHEMDRPNLQSSVHGPAAFIAAWRHIRAIFAAAGATNVNWVWCPTAWGFWTGRAQKFYPGSSEVDWVCADAYAPSAAQPLSVTAAPFLSWARHTGKPAMIGEFAVGGNPAGWPAWLAAAGQLARADHQIKALAYFDANGTDSQGRPFRYWLGDQPEALAMFGHLLAEPYFQPVFRSAP